MKQPASAIADLVHIRDIESGLCIERFANGTFYQELEQVFLAFSYRANEKLGFSFTRKINP